MINKHYLLFIMTISLVCTGCGKQTPIFEVYGDESILKHMIINMVTYEKNTKLVRIAKTQTIIFNGEIQDVAESNDMGGASFYFSYKNKVNDLVTDAFYLNQKLGNIHDANIFEASQSKGDIIIRYYKCRVDFLKKQNFIEIGLTKNKDDYLKTNGVQQEEINKYNGYFYNYFGNK
ncbi:hypothetical protein [Escherichia coli]|uniref:hypothetical protein n=1 Tax=Escherichia coli TaxID=562 RepID=UPI0038B37587